VNGNANGEREGEGEAERRRDKRTRRVIRVVSYRTNGGWKTVKLSLQSPAAFQVDPNSMSR
jgi:hypothetical protein